jgi:hypothetical protein
MILSNLMNESVNVADIGRNKIIRGFAGGSNKTTDFTYTF